MSEEKDSYRPAERHIHVPDRLNQMSPFEALDNFLLSEKEYLNKCLQGPHNILARLQASEKMGKEIIPINVIQNIFQHFAQIYSFHQGMYDELLKKRLEGKEACLESMGELLKRYIPFFKLYSTYIEGMVKSHKQVTLSRKDKVRFDQFLQLEELVHDSTLNSMLQTPRIRLPQYVMYIMAIYNGMSDKSSHAAQKLAEAGSLVSAVMTDIAEKQMKRKMRKEVLGVQKKIFNDNIFLVASHRYLIMRGQLAIVGKKSLLFSRLKTYNFFLFNDLIMWGTEGGLTSSPKVVRVVRLVGMKLEDHPGEPDFRNSFRITSTLEDALDPDGYLLTSQDDAALKTQWVGAIRESIENENKRSATLRSSLDSSLNFELAIQKKKQMGDIKIARESVMVGSNSNTSSTSNVSSLNTKFTPTPPSNANNNTAGEALWLRRKDDISGRYFYEHKKRAVTQWDEPNEPWVDASVVTTPPTNQGKPGEVAWVRMTEQSSGRFYYENRYTQVTQWDAPEGEFEDYATHAIINPSAAQVSSRSSVMPPSLLSTQPKSGSLKQKPMSRSSMMPTTTTSSMRRQPPTQPPKRAPPAGPPPVKRPPSIKGPPPTPPSIKGPPPTPPTGGPRAPPVSAPQKTTPSSGGGGGRSNLLASIQAGKSLKKVETKEPSSSGMGHVAGLSRGHQTSRSRIYSMATAESTNQTDILSAAIQNYGRFVNDDDDDDDDWD